jgi:hypothetical protein
MALEGQLHLPELGVQLHEVFLAEEPRILSSDTPTEMETSWMVSPLMSRQCAEVDRKTNRWLLTSSTIPTIFMSLR